MTKWFANMRMYSVNDAVAAHWQKLARWIGEEAGIDLQMLDHPPPASIGDLWRRDDLGLVQMCGWPFWRAEPRPHLVAAPVLDHPQADGEPVYWTEMVVRRDEAAEDLENTFGGRIAWTVEDSHSGFNAPRRLLLPHFQARQAPLYSERIGPLVTPMKAMEALLADDVDVAPIDGYFFILLNRHEPEVASKLKSIASTPSAPIPPFIASPGMAEQELQGLREALARAHQDKSIIETLQALAISRFVVPEIGSYELAESWHIEALGNNYPTPS